MKAIITFLAFIFLSVSLPANGIQSRLVVTNFDNTTLRIVVDGRHYDGVNASLALNDLSVGYHRVKVYRVSRGFFRSYHLLYSSKVLLRPNCVVNVMINRGGQVAVNEKQFGRYGRDDEQNYGRNNDRNRNGRPDFDNRKSYPGDRY